MTICAFLGSPRREGNTAHLLSWVLKEAKDLGQHLSLLQRKHAELTDGASQTAREAVVFVEKKGETPESC